MWQQVPSSPSTTPTAAEQSESTPQWPQPGIESFPQTALQPQQPHPSSYHPLMYPQHPAAAYYAPPLTHTGYGPPQQPYYISQHQSQPVAHPQYHHAPPQQHYYLQPSQSMPSLHPHYPLLNHHLPHPQAYAGAYPQAYVATPNPYYAAAPHLQYAPAMPMVSAYPQAYHQNHHQQPATHQNLTAQMHQQVHQQVIAQAQQAVQVPNPQPPRSSQVINQTHTSAASAVEDSRNNFQSRDSTTQAIMTPKESSLSMSLDGGQNIFNSPTIRKHSNNQNHLVVELNDATIVNPIQQPIKQQEQCKITLSVTCAGGSSQNQSFVVVGNLEVMGAWQIEKALNLRGDKETINPSWKSDLLVDCQQPIQYKFAKIFNPGRANMHLEWEPITQNRTIDCRGMASMVIQEVFGEPDKRSGPFVRREPQNIPLIPIPSSPAQTIQIQQKEAKTQSSTLEYCQLERNNMDHIVERQRSFELQQKSNNNAIVTEASEEILPPKKDKDMTDNHIRRLLNEQLCTAFPQEILQIKANMGIRKNQGQRPPHASDNTSRDSLAHDDKSFASRRKAFQFMKKTPSKTVEVDPSKCVIQVTHQLPYRLISKENGKFQVETNYQSPALLYGNLDELVQTKMYNFVWIGIIVTKNKMTTNEEIQATKILAEKNCYAIYYTEEEVIPQLTFYESLIRPHMHNFVDESDHQKLSTDEWNSFKQLNSRMAQRIHQVREMVHSQTIWIHGDQNMLVPYYIRQSEKIKANIGFYFHQAFPASSIFQTFLKRDIILQSLLHSDLIGFHIYEYARNFINSCQRCLGLYYELGEGNTLSVNYNKKQVQVRIQHIGLDESFLEKIIADPKYGLAREKITNTVRNAAFRESQIMRASLSRGNLNNMLQSNHRSASQPMLIGSGLHAKRNTTMNLDQQQQQTNKLQSSSNQQQSLEQIDGKIILASIDSFHQTTGLILKLQGYYNFLKAHPEYRDKIVLFQVIRGLFIKSDNMQGLHQDEENRQGQGRSGGDKNVMWLFDQVESLKALNDGVCKLVIKIRQEFGRQCLIVEQGNWDISMRLALWSKAHILFVSTLKDGLYLTCFEYIMVKHLCNDFENSAMILSEFTGNNTQFAGFFEFNPFLIKTTVKALDECLKESPQQKAQRMKRAFQYVHQRTFIDWVDNFLKELKLAQNLQAVDDTRIIFQGHQAVQFPKSSVTESQVKIENYSSRIPQPIDIKKQALQAVSHRKNLIMIDHEALPAKQIGRSDMFPRTQIIQWIQEILYDKSNILVIMSDRDRDCVSSVFESNLMEQENFWVAAESGYWLMNSTKQWKELFKVQSKQWMQTIRSIMSTYCENIDGSIIETRSSTLVWNYKNTEEEHGSKFASELLNHLQMIIGRKSPIKVVHGNGFIEVLPKKLTKRAVLKNVLENLQLYCNHQIESFLYIGADFDEDLTFQYLKDRIQNDQPKKDIDEQLRQKIVDSKALFAPSCSYSLCVLGNRPSIAHFFVELKDVQYLLKEMAFRTQSRKRVKSSSNLLDNANFNQGGQGGSSQNIRGFQNTAGVFDQSKDYQNILSQDLQTKQSPNQGRLKGRHYSTMDLLQPISLTEKEEQFQVEEAITEHEEEDNVTQMSQIERDHLGAVCDQLSSSNHNNTSNNLTTKKQLSNYKKSSNMSSDKMNQQYMKSVESDVFAKTLSASGLFDKRNSNKDMKSSQIMAQRTVSASGAEFDYGVSPRVNLISPTNNNHLLMGTEDDTQQRRNSQPFPLRISMQENQQTNEQQLANRAPFITGGITHESASMPHLQASVQMQQSNNNQATLISPKTTISGGVNSQQANIFNMKKNSNNNVYTSSNGGISSQAEAIIQNAMQISDDDDQDGMHRSSSDDLILQDDEDNHREEQKTNTPCFSVSEEDLQKE